MDEVEKEMKEYKKVFDPEELATFSPLELAWFYVGIRSSKKMDEIIARRQIEELFSMN